MKMELNEKKVYVSPSLRVTEVDCRDIIATSGEDDEYYRDRLN